MSGRAYAAPRRAPRRRVAPRSGASRIRWDRLGRVVLVIVLFGIGISYLNPVVNLVDAWRDSKAGEEKLAELKREKASLEQQVRTAESPLTMEREARKLGLVRPGEHAYVLDKLD